MKKELLAIGTLAILFALSFSGCVEENVVTAEEIKERFLHALENVTSYKYSSEVTYSITTIKESTSTTESSVAMTGEIDILNKKVKQYLNTTSEGSNEGHLILYMVDNISYFGNQTNGNTTWTSSLMGSEMWSGYSYLELIATMLENGTEQYNNTELKRVSDETVENVDCYILRFTGFQNQSATTSNAYSYIGYDVKYWIAKDTYLLKKSHLKSTIDQSGVYSFGGANRSIITSEMEIFFYDYNVPLNIVLPPEAKNTNLWPEIEYPGP
ncbi:MAG: hypothetical protein QHH19_05375 [Candidatus Thermoplasmatota archaeon]|jgi:hypothetical protein|nr:hypothetical protein [Candidatus Thermoplasmatota archaeon]